MYGGNPFFSRHRKRGKSNSHPNFADGGTSDPTLCLLREASCKLERFQRKQPSPPPRRYLEPWRENPSPRAAAATATGHGTASSTSDPEPFRIPCGIHEHHNSHHGVDLVGRAGKDDDVDMTVDSRGGSFSSDISERSSSLDASAFATLTEAQVGACSPTPPALRTREMRPCD